MPLFQKTIVKKYLKSLKSDEIEKKWNDYKNHFFNPSIQENIRNAKEEQYQEGFLRDLFVKILGYTLNPDHQFNLTTELKNIKDSKKADGGILVDDKVIGVIELKGTNTTDLGKIEAQAFGYKNNQAGCTYVITSNFEKLRFYIDNAIEHLEFNLFQLSEQDFQLLYLCLAFENIRQDIPKKIKEESISQEDVITKKLYKDYSVFKRELFQNLTQHNPQFEALDLFKKSQKLLDRFLFLFFAEDRHLLPPNSVRLILSDWNDLQERDVEIPLYDRFKKYFEYLNTGFKGKRYDVFAYNGGLFKQDEILDAVKINDQLLYKHTHQLSEYDFASEVDVNILGHIFENSLNEIEEVQAELEGQAIDKSKTKRKKDGVFYTPKYITKYIVENTIGKLCNEKKTELQFDEEAYINDKRKQKKTVEMLLQNLKEYREWLLQLTVVDPACGSGAFLNEALNFLIAEHKLLDELETKLLGGGFVFPNIENSILENNLFGVDLNEESVEIAKLSLWLRTAQPNRKLNDLSHNIKCGNSLIDDPEIAGDKAFDWEKEFPQVFAKGGFDVVIGNPPYTYRNAIQENEKKYFENNYYSTESNYELYKLFIEKSLELINVNGIISFITSSSFLIQKSFKLLRKQLLKFHIEEIIPLGGDVFENATVDTCIISVKKKNNNDLISVKVPSKPQLLTETIPYYIKQIRFTNNKDLIFNCFVKDEYFEIIKKLESNYKSLENYFEVSVGINTGYIKDELVSTSKINESYHKMLGGSDISRYQLPFSDSFIMYDSEYVKSRGKLGRTLPAEKFFNQDKLIIVRTRNFSLKRRIIATFDFDKHYTLNRLSNIISLNHNSLIGLLGILNSKLINWLFTYEYYDYEIKPIYLKQVPLTNVNDNNLVKETNQILSLNKELQEVSGKFQRTLEREFGLEKRSKKLENWQDLSYSDFLKELKKQKVELSLSQKAEWEDYFSAEQQKAKDLQNQINSTDKQIDAMVYELYSLTEDEISIIENT